MKRWQSRNYEDKDVSGKGNRFILYVIIIIVLLMFGIVLNLVSDYIRDFETIDGAGRVGDAGQAPHLSVNYIIGKSSHLVGELGVAVLVAAILFAINEIRAREELSSEIRNLQDAFEKRLAVDLGAYNRELSEQLGRASQNFINLHSLSRFQSDLDSSSLDEKGKELGKAVWNGYLSGLRFIPSGGFVLDDRDWTFDINRELYRLLSKSEIDNPIEIRHAHNRDPAAWLEGGAPRLALHQQKIFVDGDRAKRKVSRVFVGREKEPSKEHKDAIELMKRHGIDSWYCQDEKETIDDFAWIPGFNVALIWRYDSDRSRAQAIRLVPAAGLNLEDQWSILTSACKGDERRPFTSTERVHGGKQQ